MRRPKTKRPSKSSEEIVYDLAREIIVGHRSEPIADYCEIKAVGLLVLLLPDGLEAALERLRQVLRRGHDPAEVGFAPSEPDKVVAGVLHLTQARLAFHIRMKKWQSRVMF